MVTEGSDQQQVRPGVWRRCSECGRLLPDGRGECGWCGGRGVEIEQHTETIEEGGRA